MNQLDHKPHLKALEPIKHWVCGTQEASKLMPVINGQKRAVANWLKDYKCDS